MRQCLGSIALMLFMCALGLLTGCGSNLSAKAGTISITDPTGATSGQLTTLAIGGKASVAMAPVDDTANAGVDWSVVCDGSPVTGSTSNGACGTVSPAHTAAGVAAIYTAPTAIPIDNAVTISAAPTSNPSAASQATLTIVQPSISIVFSSTPVSSLYVGGTTSLGVTLGYDTTAAGAKWSISCGSMDCGSFSSTTTTTGVMTTYTAPAAVPNGSSVTIIATSVADSTKSVSTAITILPVYAVTVSVSPTTLQIGQGSIANLIATVANDSTSAGVDWTISCGGSSCGRMTSTHTANGAAASYVSPSAVPSGGPVTITATATVTKSNAQPATASATATISSAATVGVSVSSSTSTVTAGATAALTATVVNDTTNAGVTWSVSCGSTGACGSVGNAGGSGSTYTATYTAPSAVPSGGAVTVIATPNATALNGNPGEAVVTISAVKRSIAFSQTPSSSLSVNKQTSVGAVVSNDPSASGVAWSVSCTTSVAGGCGYILPYKTASGVSAVYTAPPFVPTGGTAKITATSVADSTISTSATLTITASTALLIGFVPSAPTQVETGATVNLNATVSNDSTNAGVDWSLACSGDCGYFTTTPEIPAIAPTTKNPNGVQAVPAVIATSVQGWPNGLPIPYTAPSIASKSGSVVITATAHANATISNAAAVSITPDSSGPIISGVVQAGSLPVIGARVALYAAGTSGYGSAATPVYAAGQNAYAATDSSGNFTIASGYICPSSTSQLYLLSIGGKAGTNAINENLVMMTLLGSCGSLNSTPVVVNEVTTVASAWSVAPFAANPLTTGLTSYLYLGTSSTNTAGLANAFASFNNLVNPATGQALFVTPAGNAVVPFATINTLADILDACALTGGGVSGDNSVCGNLFEYANPYQSSTETLYNGIPYDTLQAAFEVAQNPYFTAISDITGFKTSPINGVLMYAMATNSSPFQPILSSLPNDFSLSLNYTGGGGLTSASNANHFALDSTGNLWIANEGTNTVTEWNNQGAAVTSSSGYTTSTLTAPGPIAIDASGNAWICGVNGLTELNFIGEELAGSPFGGGGLTGAGCLNMAIDGSGNVWATNSASVAKFDEYGDAVSPAGGYTLPYPPMNTTTATVLKPLAIDISGNVWVGVEVFFGNGAGTMDLAELNNASGAPYYLTPDSSSTGASNFVAAGYEDITQTQIAADGSGDIWSPTIAQNTDLGSILKAPAFGGTGTTELLSGAVDCSSGGSCPLANSRGIAIDGAGVVWVGNAGYNAIQPNLTEYNPSIAKDTPGYVSSSLANEPLSVAVDISGNVWVLLGNNTVTEYVGIAVPTVTPLSLAVSKKKVGTRP